MKRKFCVIFLAVAICVLCSACNSWMNGEYISITPREAKPETYANRVIEVTSYTQLRNALSNLVRNGAEDGIISISAFNKGTIHFYVDTAISNVIENTPFGAYAVEKITYEIGTNRGVSVVACKIHYRGGYQQPEQIRQLGDAQELSDAIADALENFDRNILVFMEQYEKIEVDKIVAEFASRYPDKVVEIPTVDVSVYPDKGAERIVEISFQYNVDQIQLQQMLVKIEECFSSVEQQVQGLEKPADVCEQLYLCLTERAQYIDVVSVTPAFNLLVNGEGNKTAFCEVFARMCNRMGLNCKTVCGTRNGQEWTWNAVLIQGQYHYIDLIRCMETEEFHFLSGTLLDAYEAE